MQELNDHTTPDAADWDAAAVGALRGTRIGQYLLRQEQAFVQEHLSNVTGSLRVLEIGSSTGHVTLPLSDRSDVVLTGMDIDFHALTVFKAHSASHQAVVASAVQLPFAPSSFDSIVAIQCFRYFDPSRFLRSCHRMLRPGGWLILQAVNRLSYKRMAKRLIRRRARHHANVLPAADVLELLTGHGFDVRTVQGYNWLPIAPRVTRMSDSRLIPYAATLERALHLDRFYRVSPWILAAAQRRQLN